MGRAVVLLAVLAVVAAGLVWAINRPRPPRRATSAFVESFQLAPIVAGALPADAALRERSLGSTRSATRFWRREYAEVSFTLTAKLDAREVAPFVRAVRDSIDRRLADVNATVRGVDGENWPDDSLGTARPGQPMALTIPFATRRRVGWVAVRALHAVDDGFTMWVSLFEGPKPTE